jgi:hypothetical protein
MPEQRQHDVVFRRAHAERGRLGIAVESGRRRIAFLRLDQQTSHNDIRTVRATDGSDPVRVTNTPTVSEYAPTWQPIPQQKHGK